MERLLKLVITGLVLLDLLVQSREENTTDVHVHYIIPDLLSIPDWCQNYSCVDFDNFVTYYQDQEYATLVFLKGYHTLLNYDGIIYMLNRNLILVGEDSDVVIYDTELYFYNVAQLRIANLTLSNGLFHIVMTWGTTNLGVFSVTLLNYVLYIEEATLALLNDCKFIRGVNPLIVYRSQVILNGNTNFTDNLNSALVSYRSTITLSGIVSFANNTGITGGAMALYSSTVHLRSSLNVSFINNSAQETGGAIHIEPDMTRIFCPECFYHVLDQHAGIALYYYGNRAELGGDDIYGTSSASCEYHEPTKHIFPSNNMSMSSVSSNPMQVCLCDDDGQPQCGNPSETVTQKSVHPGERFTVPAVIVGGDHGTTIGTVHASFTSTGFHSVPIPVPVLGSGHQYSQWIGKVSECSNLQYVVNSEHIGQTFTMHLNVHYSKHIKIIRKNEALCDTKKHGYDSSTPAFINLTILPCPAGFSLFQNPSTCDCHLTLTNEGVKCEIVDGKSYFAWNNTPWISVNSKGFTYAKYCPLHYCDPGEKRIELEKEPFAQCALNRAGRLCGGCKDGYSLAIGSSHCIHCPNNNGLALLIFFAAAGLLLVFFVNVLDITLTQGLLDGLIFYAHIVWTYQSVLFPGGYRDTNAGLLFLKTFIAWLNLDFGIETCFTKGLTAYWKTWLQFIFPFYLWAIVGLMIFSARHSRTLTKLYGNRVVPVLATLFLLSYMKLLRTVTSIYMFSVLWQYPQKIRTTVWSVDGNIDYFGLPHSFLLVAALLVQTLLWLPYTLCLLFYQLLQKVSHFRIFKWITNQQPFFDVHFAPFKPSHRYWFGVLLLARGVLLVAFSSSFAAPKNANLLLLLIAILLLLLYMAVVQPYKNKIVLTIESSFLANILLLSAFTLYAETQENQHAIQRAAVGISIGVAFLQFCGIVVCNAIRLCCCKRRGSHRYRADFEDELELDENFATTYRAYIMNALF